MCLWTLTDTAHTQKTHTLLLQYTLQLYFACILYALLWVIEYDCKKKENKNKYVFKTKKSFLFVNDD